MSRSRVPNSSTSPNFQQWHNHNKISENSVAEDEFHKLRISMNANQIVNNRQMHVALQNHEQQLNVVEITQPTKNGIKRREVPQYLLKVKNITTNAEKP